MGRIGRCAIGLELDCLGASCWGEGISAGLPLGSYGHVPNGGRVYYLQRSQPPLLTLMMDCYLTHTNDTTFLQWVPPFLCCSADPPPTSDLSGMGMGSAPGLRCCLLHSRENIETLALELDFWTKNRTVSVSLDGKNYLLNRYYVPYGGPR